MEMTRDVEVSDATFAAVKTAVPDNQQTVELVAIIAAYNMVSRFLVALKIDVE
jgi:alkylhydroperoxidase family enzyme